MSAVPVDGTSMVTAPPAPVRSHGPSAFVRDTTLITHRHLLRMWRTPQIMVLSAVMPVMFVLLFRYVFGGSIHVPGYTSYVDFLIPGVLVQTVIFGASSTAVGLADDLSKGITDRFRSLPIHRGAILAARTLADVIRLSYTVALLIGVGLLVGFRMHTDVLHVAAGLGIAVFFGYACSWLFALLALGVRDTETAQLAAFLVTFPFVFAASTFTSTAMMPGWLQTFADNQPVTKVADALRALMEGTAPASGPALSALIWSAGILIVSATLATWRFRRT
ncbi:MAG TPA: ABC transporter permease [Baekduia sp.]|uniref:ABC transporter permease n=1 Tax=Baekduia sp. TaxID=2600305 RepID=UPI002C4D296B|nr:ABC transporter permease [Baekduia sp.]HMJ34270.1 ABC transporter permease [Baekduia sp.]